MEKLRLYYFDDDNNASIETVWIEPIGDFYKIANIPFCALSIALGDIVSAELVDGWLEFKELIKTSEHSTIQIAIMTAGEGQRIVNTLQSMGCSWEAMKHMEYYAVDVPATLDYADIKAILENESEASVLDYREACLSDKHREDIGS